MNKLDLDSLKSVVNAGIRVQREIDSILAESETSANLEQQKLFENGHKAIIRFYESNGIKIKKSDIKRTLPVSVWINKPITAAQATALLIYGDWQGTLSIQQGHWVISYTRGATRG